MAAKSHRGFRFSHVVLLFCFVSSLFLINAANSDSIQIQNSELTVGVNADLSLAAAVSGKAIIAGVRLAVDELNERGGVLGRKLKIEIRDHAGVSSRGIANVREFSGFSNIIGVIGGVHSNVILSEIEIIHQSKIPYLIPWASAREIVDNGRSPNFVFRLGGREGKLSEFLVREALSRGKNVALVLENTVWGRGNRAAIMTAMQKRGRRLVSVQWVDRGDVDVSPQIFALIAAKTDVLLMVLNGPESALVINQLAARKAPFSIVSHWGLTSGGFYEKASESVQKLPLYFIQAFSFLRGQNPVKKELLRRYQKTYDNIEPDLIPAVMGIAHAYDLTRMLAEAVKKAGVIDREKIRDALEELPAYSGASLTYAPPFTQSRHEALDERAYFLARFNKRGGIEPN